MLVFVYVIDSFVSMLYVILLYYLYLNLFFGLCNGLCALPCVEKWHKKRTLLLLLLLLEIERKLALYIPNCYFCPTKRTTHSSFKNTTKKQNIRNKIELPFSKREQEKTGKSK